MNITVSRPDSTATGTGRRPRLLDLFCGAGLAARGYTAAGFDVVGVDILDQPDYPYEFHRADAMAFDLAGFDAIHASPPCQGETALKSLWSDRDYDRPLHATIERLQASAVPWVVENVDRADGPSGVYRVRLCGSSFGLAVRRHRWFWSNVAFLVPGCEHGRQGTPVGVYGNGGGTSVVRGTKATRANGWAAMGVPDRCCSWRGLTNGIPPAYTELLGSQLIAAVTR